MAALGAALHFVGRRRPFADFAASVLIETLHGQIARGHYLVALDGARLRGFMGWVLLETTVAERLARGGSMPSPAEAASNGPVLWILTVAATDRPALLACVRQLRRLHPGRRVMGVRHGRRGGMVLFDQPIRPRQDEVGAPAGALRP